MTAPTTVNRWKETSTRYFARPSTKTILARDCCQVNASCSKALGRVSWLTDTGRLCDLFAMNVSGDRRTTVKQKARLEVTTAVSE